MANRKINELSPRTPSLTDLIIVGDPSTGYSFKATISVLAAFAGSNIQFSSLQGISITSPTNGQALVYDGTNWVNQNISVPVTSVFGRTGVVVATEGDYSLDLLSDVTLTSPTTNQVLQYNGTAWVNATFVAGINSLNGLTATTQTFATGTSGTDFAIVSSTSTHTFNLPTASAVNRGALSSADWSTFNAKQDAITLTTTGSSGASTLVGATLNVPTYTLAGLGGVSGSGTTNYLPKWTGSTALGNSLVYDNGTGVGIGTASPTTNSLLTLKSSSLTNQHSLSLVGWDNTYTGGVILLTNDGTSVNYKISAETTQGIVLKTEGSTFQQTFRFATGASGKILGNSTGLYIRSETSRDLDFGSNNTNSRMIIKSGGNVLIGTTTDAGYKLDVSGTFRSTLDANINGLTVGEGGGSVATNTAVGVSAISATATGGANTAVGYQSLQNITSATRNVAVGYRILTTNTTGTDNIGVGANYTSDGTSTLFSLTSGSRNIGLGNGALRGVTTGSDNIGLGRGAGYDLTTGQYNVIIGNNGTFGNGITTGNYNTIIGSQVTGLSSSLSNTIILADGQGNQRLYINSSGDVGIGTTSPTQFVEVKKDQNAATRLIVENATSGTAADATIHARISSTNLVGLSKVSASYTTYKVINALDGVLYNGNQGNLVIFNDASNQQIRFATGGSSTSQMTLFSNGNLGVGVGTTDAGYKLDVNGTFRTNSTIRFGSSSSNSFIYAEANGYTTQSMNFQLGGSSNLFGLFRAWGSTSSTTLGGITTASMVNLFSQAGPIMVYANANNIYFNSSNTTPSMTIVHSTKNVLIGTTTDDASAILNVSSTTKGFLPPRMTNAQMVAIATPAAGLVVYDTTNNKLNVYDGTNWVAVH